MKLKLLMLLLFSLHAEANEEVTIFVEYCGPKASGIYHTGFKGSVLQKDNEWRSYLTKGKGHEICPKIALKNVTGIVTLECDQASLESNKECKKAELCSSCTKGLNKKEAFAS